ncbi:uncharacterized protein KY384_007952 [Bacidia gigantensis]|uniref:uncharacterized protein n=1 Tax=Bacidia gigantensis TaxID=2732470 RepID=UPI001D041148|nr:uncharacterized protein KY384_007952 [Bacidia gigantensis]KAG8527798.1 hypothetical protein KY384_007952 [Bacidia gigantensis]
MTYMHKAKRQKKLVKSSQEGSNDEVLRVDIEALRKHAEAVDSAKDKDKNATPEASSNRNLPEKFTEIEVKVERISSTGNGIGFSNTKDHVYVVPFTVPGDHVKAKVVHNFADEKYSLTDFVEITTPGHQRNDSLIRCKYFARCGGCQLQMLPYDVQLQHKKSIIEKAYRNFSSLIPEAVPAVENTIGSPMQYGYRTKLTPHFDGPPGSLSRRAKLNGEGRKFETVPPIGFMIKGTRKTIDIEDCPIGTDSVRNGMVSERKRVTEEIGKYSKGATLLLRESTSRTPNDEPRTSSQIKNKDSPKSDKESQTSSFTELKSCITDSNATATEYIDSYIFQNTAGAFFQNNNSILPKFTSYIRDRILPAPPSRPSSPAPSLPHSPSQPTTPPRTPQIKYLLDAYCGSGLFTITLSTLFKSSLGIDISSPSIASAAKNASLNNVKNCTFRTADAADIFAGVDFPADETAVVIDPPRKGCDANFLGQLLRFGPRRVVYVSCNVHTQARDVGVLVEGRKEGRKGNGKASEDEGEEGGRGDVGDVGGGEGGKGVKYEIESLQGFDFFPQTGHVESVAILRRV